MKYSHLIKVTTISDEPGDPYNIAFGWGSDKDEYWTDGIGGPTEGFFVTKDQMKELLKHSEGTPKFVLKTK